jgi:hypothetical protein
MASISLKGFESLIKEDKGYHKIILSLFFLLALPLVYLDLPSLVKKDLSCLIKEKWKHFMNIKRCLPQTPRLNLLLFSKPTPIFFLVLY